MSKRVILACIALIACGAFVLVAGSAGAQTVKKSTISGTVVTKAAVVTSPGSPVTVFTVPEGGFFILTQFCSSGESATLTGNTLGTFLKRSFSNTECTTYSPGLAIPGLEVLTCDIRAGSNEPCTVI